MILTLESYWNGRLVTYAGEATDVIRANGAATHAAISALVEEYVSQFPDHQLPGGYSSGWRPKAINNSTANAAAKSNHLLALAGDVRDSPKGELTWFLFRNQSWLRSFSLYMEHPIATVIGKERPWCHLQTVAPGSGLRVFFPNTAAAQEWQRVQGRYV